MAKPIIDPERAKIRAMAGFLEELEFLELLDGCEIKGFSLFVRRLDGGTEKLETYLSPEHREPSYSGRVSLRMRFFKDKLTALIREYRKDVERELSDMSGNGK